MRAPQRLLSLAVPAGLAGLFASASIPLTAPLPLPQWFGKFQVVSALTASVTAVGLGAWTHRCAENEEQRCRARWAMVLGGVPLFFGALTLGVATLVLRHVV